MAKQTELDTEEVWNDFGMAVNMTPSELEKWLTTDESKESGWKEGDGKETIGHHSGRRIVEIKRKKKGDLSEDDYSHMRKVVGYVHRHVGQGGPQKNRNTRRGDIRS